MPVVVGTRVVLPAGIGPAAIRIDDGIITDIGPWEAGRAGDGVIDAGALLVSPGIVDTHVHINEPGRTEWEGFETATRAAAAGGVTTVVDMPLNSVPATTSVAALEAKRQAAARGTHVDVGFWGGVVPGQGAQIAPLLAAGVRGFKCFLSPSGVPEFDCVSERHLREAMPLMRCAGRVPLLVHAEDPTHLQALSGDPRAYASYLASRPVAAEVRAIELMARLALEFDQPVHVVHVSSADGAAVIARLRAAGVPISAETCQHYLTFEAAQIPAGATAFKCAPPIRDARHREALWQALRDGALQMMATDHSPAPPGLKQTATGNFSAAWGGIASLQLALSAAWTEASSRGFDATHLAAWLSAGPAALAGLDRRKGAIAVGRDADLVFWDPDARFTVAGASLAHRHPLTPYEGRELAGAVRATYLRGECVWRDGQLVRPSHGRLI